MEKVRQRQDFSRRNDTKQECPHTRGCSTRPLFQVDQEFRHIRGY
jgi:hypothetical protein